MLRRGQTPFVTLIAFILLGIVVGVSIFSVVGNARHRDTLHAQQEAVLLGSTLALAPILGSNGEFTAQHKLQEDLMYRIKGNTVEVSTSKFFKTYHYAGYDLQPAISEGGGKIVITSSQR